MDVEPLKCSLCGETDNREVYNCREVNCPYPAGLIPAPTFQEQQTKAHYGALLVSLDVLAACWIAETGKAPSQGTILDLIEWTGKKAK